jgi:hypothetical protein
MLSEGSLHKKNREAQMCLPSGYLLEQIGVQQASDELQALNQTGAGTADEIVIDSKDLAGLHCEQSVPAGAGGDRFDGDAEVRVAKQDHIGVLNQQLLDAELRVRTLQSASGVNAAGAIDDEINEVASSSGPRRRRVACIQFVEDNRAIGKSGDGRIDCGDTLLQIVSKCGGFIFAVGRRE